MVDIIIIVVILAIVTLAVAKIVSEKKKGRRCIGCPHSSGCSNENKE